MIDSTQTVEHLHDWNCKMNHEIWPREKQGMYINVFGETIMAYKTKQAVALEKYIILMLMVNGDDLSWFIKWLLLFTV